MATDPIRFKPPSEKVPDAEFAEIWAGHFDMPLDRDCHLITIEELMQQIRGASESEKHDSGQDLTYEPDTGNC